MGILEKLKSKIGGGSDIDSKIDSAFSKPRDFQNSGFGQSAGAGSASSVSERVLEGQRKFGEQFRARANPEPATQFSSNSPADFGRFSEDGINQNISPASQIDDDERILENLGAQKSQFLKHNDARGFSERRDMHDSPALTKQAEYRPATYIGGSNSGNNGRIFEELEDLRVQNEEILRRLKRIEEKLRG